MPDTKRPNADAYARLGEALKRLRQTAGLTQVSAGEQVGVRSQFVSEVERGNRGLRWHTLLAFLDAYGASLHDLADAFER
jgi:transcriptional regulator with XRE-family HTH domain